MGCLFFFSNNFAYHDIPRVFNVYLSVYHTNIILFYFSISQQCVCGSNDDILKCQASQLQIAGNIKP